MAHSDPEDFACHDVPIQFYNLKNTYNPYIMHDTFGKYRHANNLRFEINVTDISHVSRGQAIRIHISMYIFFVSPQISTKRNARKVLQAGNDCII